MADALFADWIEFTIEGPFVHVRLGLDGPQHDGDDHTVAHFVLPKIVVDLIVKRWTAPDGGAFGEVKTFKDGPRAGQKVIRVDFDRRQRLDPPDV